MQDTPIIVKRIHLNQFTVSYNNEDIVCSLNSNGDYIKSDIALVEILLGTRAGEKALLRGFQTLQHSQVMIQQDSCIVCMESDLVPYLEIKI